MRAFFEDLQQRLEQRSVLIYSKGKFDDIPATGKLLTTATALK